jgi:hypothetical protein
MCVLVAAACGGLEQSPSINDMGGGGGGFGGGSDGTGGGGGGNGSGGGGGAVPLSSCGSDADCELASSACCECPTFALNVADANSGCSEVTCGAMTCSQNVRAACLQDECQLQCVPLECDLSCADGFVVDTSGCLTCACAEPSQDACTPDANQAESCVEVPADCCGCARGGKDVAILQSQVAQFQASLNCPADPQCPETDTCDAGAHATCSQSRCELLDNADQPANECGLPTDAGCGSNVCVINAIDAANARHVGVCLGSP